MASILMVFRLEWTPIEFKSLLPLNKNGLDYSMYHVLAWDFL